MSSHAFQYCNLTLEKLGATVRLQPAGEKIELFNVNNRRVVDTNRVNLWHSFNASFDPNEAASSTDVQQHAHKRSNATSFSGRNTFNTNSGNNAHDNRSSYSNRSKYHNNKYNSNSRPSNRNNSFNSHNRYDDRNPKNRYDERQTSTRSSGG